MSYTKTVWEDLPSTNTPITAENLNNMEDGIETNDKKLSGEEVIGNIVVDSIRTKNIFGNYAIINGWISGTTMRVVSINGNRMAFVSCKPNTTYTISRSVKTSTFRVSDYTTIPTMTTSNVDYTIPTAIENNDGTTITYTTSSTAKYLIIHYGREEESTISSSLATIQVEEGSTVTEYTPYQNLDATDEKIIRTAATPNSSYISTIQMNDVVKCGKIVTVDFRGLVSANIPNNTTIITLPYHFVAQGTAPAYLGGAYDYASTLWCSWGNNGNVFRAGQGFTSASGKYVHIHLVYITSD